MDLRSGCLYWPAVNPPPRNFAPLDAERECDVAVIGGGITGALVAYHLLEAGIKVILLDRRSICSGSTPASTGLLQYEIDTPLVELIEQVGREHAARVSRERARAGRHARSGAAAWR